MEDKKVICSTCRIQFDNVVDYKMHISGDYHIYNTKRRVAGLEPIGEELFEEKKASLQQQSQCQSQLSEVLSKCRACKKTFKSAEQLEQHKKSKNHKKAEKEFLGAHPESLQSSLFQNITTDRPLAGSVASLLSQSEHDEEDERKEEREPERTSLDSLRICLFCNRELSGVKKCLDHMRRAHSFYVLDVDCVTSLKGLLTYIAERIQLGYMCLLCSRMFRSARRCQQHMMDKAHCFMNVDDEHEYQQYYDFSHTYEEGKVPLITKKVTESEEKAPEGEWEDVDVEDDDSGEGSDQEGAKSPAKSEASAKTFEDGKTGSEASFSVITDGQQNTPSKGEFTDVGGAHASGHQPGSSAFNNISESHPDIVGDSLSSIKGGETIDGRNKKQGMTKEEAMLGLKIKKAQLLETGEVLLGNGKIIGSRSLRYMYKQRYRFPDSREAVVVNKLAVEYRRIKALTNGGLDPEVAKSRVTQDFIHQQVLSWKKQLAKDLKQGMKLGKTITRPMI